MESDKDVRDAILLLVNACNDYQMRSLALSMAFRALQLYPTEKRDGLCERELQAEVLKAYNIAEIRVGIEAQDIKSALDGSGPFLELLTKFASRHYSEFEQILSRPLPH